MGITLKKTIKKTAIKKPESGAQGSAAIADRFKLAPAEPADQAGMVNKKAAMWALIAGLLALAASGILTYVLYQHWEFLMPA